MSKALFTNGITTSEENYYFTKGYQQGRADAIEECIKVNHIAWDRHINDYSLGVKRRGQLNAMFSAILDDLEQLKEQEKTMQK